MKLDGLGIALGRSSTSAPHEVLLDLFQQMKALATVGGTNHQYPSPPLWDHIPWCGVAEPEIRNLLTVKKLILFHLGIDPADTRTTLHCQWALALHGAEPYMSSYTNVYTGRTKPSLLSL